MWVCARVCIILGKGFQNVTFLDESDPPQKIKYPLKYLIFTLSIKTISEIIQEEHQKD